MRRKATGVQAIQLTAPAHGVRLVSGELRDARSGDILITNESTVLDVLTHEQYQRDWEAVHPESLTLEPKDCYHLELTLGLGSTRTAADLTAAVDRLASLSFGEVKVPFTPGQLAEIQHRAAKRGRTVEAEMKAVVDRIQDELFHKAG